MDHSLLVVLAVIGAVVLIAILAFAILLLVRLIALRRLVNAAGMPISAKAAFYGALIYTVFPIDVLPDPIYLDDVGVLVAAIAFITKAANDRGLLTKGRRPGRGGSPLDDVHHP